MGVVAYLLALPPSLSSVHEVLDVSMLRKYTLDPAHVVDWGEITVDKDGTFEEGPVHIIDSPGSGFATQDHEASESDVATLWSGGGNVGA